MTLKQDILNDTAVFMDNSEFGVEVTYTPFEGVPAVINVVFDENAPIMNPETGQTEGFAPMVLVRSSDVPDIAHKDTLVINSVTYAVVEPILDQDGIKEIPLIKQ